ncbi:MAG: NupC/NupG family nucleoside CNT transporter [Planctomycetota bacterium]|nr:MAG: NupC/NupG family nucleoside CNT transporter [Planctomycetota bacterium]
MHQSIAACGYCVMIFLAWLMSSHRRRFPWRVVLGGTMLQLIFAVLTIKTKLGHIFFINAGACFNTLMDFVDEGNVRVFGENFRDHYFAFKVLPTIIFFSALMSVLYHLGIMQFVVRILSYVMQATLGTSGAESLSASANIFVGMTEAPLVIRPYVARMTRSELMAVMVGGFATVAGGVMALYIGWGIDPGHLMTASVISAPAGLLIAKVLQPEVDTPETLGVSQHAVPPETSNLIEAATNGAADGLKLALNVGAMLLAFWGLIAMLDYGLTHGSAWVFQWLGHQDWQSLTMSRILGVVFSPIAWLMGVEWKECSSVGQLLGVKMVATELVAYAQLDVMMGNVETGIAPTLSPRAIIISTYALCGFANFASIGVQIGGIGAIAPERRTDLTQLGMRAMLGGSLACCMTACIAGILIA